MSRDLLSLLLSNFHKTFQVPRRSTLFWSAQALSKTKITSSHGNHGAAAYGSLPPPVGHPRLFRLMAQVDRDMGGAAYDQRHQNQTGGPVLPNNPPRRLN